jgi:hypothetical protein
MSLSCLLPLELLLRGLGAWEEARMEPNGMFGAVRREAGEQHALQDVRGL